MRVCLFGYCESVDRRARKGARDDKMVGNKKRSEVKSPAFFTLHPSIFTLPFAGLQWIATGLCHRDKTELLQNRPD